MLQRYWFTFLVSFLMLGPLFTQDSASKEIASSQSSSLLFSPPFPISPLYYKWIRLPAVGFGGSNYLVAWWRGEGGGFTGGSTKIYAARVSPSGVPLDISWIPVSETFGMGDAGYGLSEFPSIASDGNNYLIVWAPWDGFGVYFARVDSSGNVLAPGQVLLDSSAFPWGVEADVSFDGSNYFVVWRDPPDKIVGARIDTSGNILDTLPYITISQFGILPEVGFDGTNYFVVWYNIYRQSVIFWCESKP